MTLEGSNICRKQDSKLYHDSVGVKCFQPVVNSTPLGLQTFLTVHVFYKHSTPTEFKP